VVHAMAIIPQTCRGWKSGAELRDARACRTQREGRCQPGYHRTNARPVEVPTLVWVGEAKSRIGAAFRRTGHLNEAWPMRLRACGPDARHVVG
jgi:hypothetical protein